MGKSYPTTFQKIISIILGTLVTGFMWRCRGDGGFGMFSAALVLLLLIYNFYGKRAGMKFELIPIGALLMLIGKTGYGTVIDQLSGTVWSDLPYPFASGAAMRAPVSMASAATIIMIMGFTLVPLFAFFIGTIFSDKKYNLGHYVVAIVIFFAVSTIAKATVAHPILKAINPDQVEWAAKGLLDYGVNMTPQKAYMTHFLNRSFAQDIAFNENYYMSIKHISDALAVVAVSLYALIGKKDKIAFASTIVIDGFVAVGTTAFSSLIGLTAVKFDIDPSAEVSSIVASGNGWTMWEFLTGLCIGFITMLFIALLPKKYTENTVEDCTPMLKNRKADFIFKYILTVFAYIVIPSRIIGLRIADLLEYNKIVEDVGAIGEIICAVLSVIFAIIMNKKMYGNYFGGFDNYIGAKPVEFSKKAFVGYFYLCAFAYFFLGCGYVYNFPYDKITSFGAFINVMLNQQPTLTAMICSLIVISVLYWPVRKKLSHNS